VKDVTGDQIAFHFEQLLVKRLEGNKALRAARAEPVAAPRASLIATADSAPAEAS